MGGVGAAFQRTYDVLAKGETPQAPTMPALPASPNPNNPDTSKDMEDAASAQRRAKGRASTYLTGSQGLTTQATTASRTLLGS